ncbi:hypothetical protein ACFQ60_47775 [Streptomyces zhihengii]
MAALGYHATDPDRGARPCFHLKPGSYDTATLIEVLEQMKVFYGGERVGWSGTGPHTGAARCVTVSDQDWLTMERLPAYAPELNPVELQWSSPRNVNSPTSPATTSPTPPSTVSTA